MIPERHRQMYLPGVQDGHNSQPAEVEQRVQPSP